MANLFFPQLSTGALVQYPVKRSKSVHTVSTQAEDGSVLTYFDPKGSMLTWQLEYAGITQAEVNQLQVLFDACAGRLRTFTFIDPLANLLTGQWQAGTGIQAAGSTYTNAGNLPAELSQTFSLPSGYAYCFSIRGNLNADPSATLTLIRRGSVTEERTVLPVMNSLLISNGALPDAGQQFIAAILLQPGQSVNVSQAQLEAQPAPSPFRPAQGGVYSKANWAVDELLFTATGPDLFSTKFSIETNV
jgi:hypothetical protein